MLFVTIIQSLAVGFTIIAMFKNTLMISPEKHGVTCNITQNATRHWHRQNITAEHLIVYWGWNKLQIRWDVRGDQNTQIWLSETYRKTYDYRCRTKSPTKAPTISPTVSPTPPTKAPILTKHPTRSPHNHPTPKPTASPTTYNVTTASPISHQRKLLQYIDNGGGKGEVLSFEVPTSLQYDSPLTLRSSLPSVFYPLPPLQMTDTYGQSTVDYVYPFQITAVYTNQSTQQTDKSRPSKPTETPTNNVTTSQPTPKPTILPPTVTTAPPTKSGCDDLNIVIETGKSYFSLLVCGLICAAIAWILLIAPTCHLVSIKMRRLLKQIVIGLNTLSFMLLLMAFAIWFAYFSTNIVSVVEEEGANKFGVCVLGEPTFGESIAWLLSGWILIGFGTMGACYLSNRPKRWYRFLRQKRTHLEAFGSGQSLAFNQQLNINGTIEEETDSDMESDDDDGDYNRMDGDSNSSNDSRENRRLDGLMHRTPSNHSSGSNETYMTADNSFGTNVVMKGDAYPVTYSPLG